MRATGTPVGPRRHEDTSLGDDNGVAEAVEADQTSQRLDPLPERGISLAGGAEPGELLVVELHFERFLQRLLGLAGFVFEELQQVGFPLLPALFQRGERNLGLFTPRAGQSQKRFGSPLGGVIEQPFVDVADLFDVERPEADATERLLGTARDFRLQILE